MMSEFNGITNSVWFHPAYLPPANELAKYDTDGQTRKIIVFGQTGSGKSSLINMLASHTVAKVVALALMSTTLCLMWTAIVSRSGTVTPLA